MTSCFDNIRATAQTLHLKESIAAGPLAVVWIILSLSWKLPDPYSFLTLFSVLPLIPVQNVVNKMNQTANPACEENRRFTAWNIATVALVVVFFILALIGDSLPPE